jgi:hypothetical protein
LRRFRRFRRFRRSPAGRLADAINHLAGERLFGSMLRTALKAVERASPADLPTETQAAA